MWHEVFVAINALLSAAIFASAVLWVRLIRRLWGQGPVAFLESVLPSSARQRPFWNPTDVLVMFGSMMVIGQLAMIAIVSQGWAKIPQGGEEAKSITANDLVASIVSTSIAGLSGIAVVLLWLRFFDADARRKLGLTFGLGDLWLGLRAALMILPPVMLVSAAAAYFVPYEHPVLDSLAELTTPTVFLATFVGTAIVTPLVEETLVRGLLQGGLQGLADHESGADGSWRPRAFWPLVLASLIFACLHIGQGAAPIPLFVLSLGLGYLYRQTGCLAAPVVVHALLNGLTLLVELVKIQSA